MKTNKEIKYGHDTVIPKGTRVERADNLPSDSEIKFWAMPWRGMSESQKAWCRNYGYGIAAEDVMLMDIK